MPNLDAVNRGLQRISQDLALPTVVTNDLHYTDETDWEDHDTYICILTGTTRTDCGSPTGTTF